MDVDAKHGPLVTTAARAPEALGRYGALAQILHWTTAALVASMIGLGFYMTQDGLDLGARFQLYQLHKSIGVTILLLTALRIGVRLAWPAPTLPRHMPGWEKAAAIATHVILYALLLGMTLSGWAMISVAAFSVPTLLYGVIPWPHLPFLETLPAEEKKYLESIFKQVHFVLALSLTAFSALHIAAALRHGILLKDGVMSRMLPNFSSKTAVIIAGAMAFAAAAFPGEARSFEWDVNQEKSRIGFEANAGGQAVKGAFAKFKATVRFDADALGDTEIDVAIDTASASTGTAPVDAELGKSDWFDVKQHPQATFAAKGARETGEGKYETSGELSIRGVKKPVTLPFTLMIERGDATAEGEITIKRADFNFGPQTLPGGIPLADDVKITLSITALRLDN